MNEPEFVNINFVNWEQETAKGLVLLDFWAEWCSACVAQDRIYKEIKEKYGDKIKIGKIHVGDNRVLSDKFGVRNVPYLILLRDGKPVMQMPGIQSKEYLFSQIEKYINNE
jgi:thioredoxin 1